MLLGLVLILVAVAATALVAVKYWNANSKASRVYCVLSGGGVGAAAGSCAVVLRCWLFWPSLYSYCHGEVGVLFIFSLGASLVGGLVGLVFAFLIRQSFLARRALLVLAPGVLPALWVAFRAAL